MNMPRSASGPAMVCAVLAPAPLFSALLNYRRLGSGGRTAALPGLAAGLGGDILAAVGRETNYPVTLSVDDLGEGFGTLAPAP